MINSSYIQRHFFSLLLLFVFGWFDWSNYSYPFVFTHLVMNSIWFICAQCTFCTILCQLRIINNVIYIFIYLLNERFFSSSSLFVSTKREKNAEGNVFAFHFRFRSVPFILHIGKQCAYLYFYHNICESPPTTHIDTLLLMSSTAIKWRNKVCGRGIFKESLLFSDRIIYFLFLIVEKDEFSLFVFFFSVSFGGHTHGQYNQSNEQNEPVALTSKWIKFIQLAYFRCYGLYIVPLHLPFGDTIKRNR